MSKLSKPMTRGIKYVVPEKKSRQIIYGVCPSKSNSYRIGKNGLYKTKAMIQYEKDFYIQCNLYRNKLISGYFELHLDVFYPNQRSDLDGALKAILDCLQSSRAIVNDNKCVRIDAVKFLDIKNPRIEFEIREV